MYGHDYECDYGCVVPVLSIRYRCGLLVWSSRYRCGVPVCTQAAGWAFACPRILPSCPNMSWQNKCGQYHNMCDHHRSCDLCTPCFDLTPLFHTDQMLIVGYHYESAGSANNYWTLKNSWDVIWGSAGRHEEMHVWRNECVEKCMSGEMNV